MFRNLLGKGVVSRQYNDTTLIGAGTTIEGDIVFSGTLEVEGRVHGDIRALDDTEAVARILPGGHVRGAVLAPVIVINGEVVGNVYSTEHVELASAAVIHGDIEYSLIEMTKGAQLNGRLLYRSAPADSAASRGSVPRPSEEGTRPVGPEEANC
ncbi:MAG: polymer-forming cytoskeletal protein [Gammaproteobacteria bacterium]